MHDVAATDVVVLSGRIGHGNQPVQTLEIQLSNMIFVNFLLQQSRLVGKAPKFFSRGV